eukprot:scaffold15199_cov193-Alexandrium_tamarense.AAC.3
MVLIQAGGGGGGLRGSSRRCLLLFCVSFCRLQRVPLFLPHNIIHIDKLQLKSSCLASFLSRYIYNINRHLPAVIAFQETPQPTEDRKNDKVGGNETF